MINTIISTQPASSRHPQPQQYRGQRPSGCGRISRNALCLWRKGQNHRYLHEIDVLIEINRLVRFISEEEFNIWRRSGSKHREGQWRNAKECMSGLETRQVDKFNVDVLFHP